MTINRDYFENTVLAELAAIKRLLCGDKCRPEPECETDAQRIARLERAINYLLAQSHNSGLQLKAFDE